MGDRKPISTSVVKIRQKRDLTYSLRWVSKLLLSIFFVPKKELFHFLMVMSRHSLFTHIKKKNTYTEINFMALKVI